MFTSLIRWIGQHLVWLAVIIAILVGVAYIHREAVEFMDATTRLADARHAHADLERYLEDEARKAAVRVRNLERAGLDALQERILSIDAEAAAVERESSFRSGIKDAFGGDAIALVKRQVRRELLRKESAYLRDVLNFAVAHRRRDELASELQRLRQRHEIAYADYTTKEAELASFRESKPLGRRIPFTESSKQHHQLVVLRDRAHRDNADAHAKYEAQRAQMDALPIFSRPTSVQFAASSALDEFRSQSKTIEEQLRSNWLSRIAQPVEAVLPIALMVLAGVILLPYVIRTFLYYAVAPFAGRRPAFELIPGSRGAVSLQGPASAVSQVVEVGPGYELLVDPQYLQSTAIQGSKSTKWFLDASRPLTSIASGMVGLTRIRTEDKQAFVVSPMKDPLSEVALLSLPEGSAMVLQPRALVGILQPIDLPVKVTSHWKLGSLSAWLTLQFRYLIFHAPAVLIVKGCRGVRVEAADAGRSVNQAATIGFSANVGYSVRRTETFVPYVFGKEDLFNDHFAGAPGFYVYEEVPHAARKAGVGGRGIEGVFDACLKAFGI